MTHPWPCAHNYSGHGRSKDEEDIVPSQEAFWGGWCTNGSLQYMREDKTQDAMTTQKRVTSSTLGVHRILPAGDT